MSIAQITADLDDGRTETLAIGYEIIGPPNGRPWVITPGGRFARDAPGVRELAEALAERGHRVLIWDRPNTGESDVCFAGTSESAMQADFMAGLLRQLQLTPANIIGGSGGARVALLAAARHPDVANALAVWWITGGPLGLMSIAMNYCAPSIRAAWSGGMEAVAELPDWEESIHKNPANRDRILGMDRVAFLGVMQRWMDAHSSCDGALMPGLSAADAAAITVPALVLRSGASDPIHTRKSSEQLAAALPEATLAEPPWPDTVCTDSKPGFRFIMWPDLAPMLDEWAKSIAPL